MQKRFLNIQQCSAFLNLSVHFLYKLTAQKSIPHVKFGRKLLFDVQRLEKFIEQNSVEVQDLNEEVRELLK